ncbi:MAG: terpene cyclase/mutase family protein [Planctomycetes bacterium]|nr:terpene cyclase/mutase family protein [Planctomycetota bacterium]
MALHDERIVRRFVAFAKNSPWILIAVGLHVILGAALSVVVIRHERQKSSASATAIAVGTTRQEPELVIPPPEEIDRRKIPDNEQVYELVSIEEEANFIPSEELPEEVDYAEPIGDPTGFDGDTGPDASTSIGVGIGGHRGDGNPSPWLQKRPGNGGAVPRGRLPVGGVAVVTEEAVLEGLRWLARHQNEDGSWSVSTLGQHCGLDSPCIPRDLELDTSFDVGMTSLALLAFLGHGISTSSMMSIVDPVAGVPHRAGEVVKKGIQWLRERQKPDGSFSDGGCFELPENDTLPTMALCEAAALARGSNVLRRNAQKALDFLIAAQKRAPDGSPWGWGIGSQQDIDERHARGELDLEGRAEASHSVDLSITCWVVMALKSAESCGFDVPEAALAGALAYGIDATGEGALESDENAFADDGREFTLHTARKAALGMLIRIFAGGDSADPFLEKAARELAADVPEVTRDQLSVDFYYWYFATLALNQYDGQGSPRKGSGKYWEPWNKGLVAALPPLQERTKKKDDCARGGWLQEARGNRRGRALYNTALNVLTLEVYYRFDNVFGAAARARPGAK